ncbi:YceI family protein [Spirosoma gilvum]
MLNTLGASVALTALLFTSHLGPGTGGNEGQKNAAIHHHSVKATTFTVDPTQSTISWNSKKVGGQHNGIVKIAKGQLGMAGNKLTEGTFVADMTTMRDVDKGEANPFNERLVNHLKSEDFFGVEKYPTSTFTITSVKPISGAKAGEPNYTISGDLTIKNTTKPQTFPATVNLTGNMVQATAKLTVNRLDYDIKYRAAIIGTAADKIIDDTFALDLKIVAAKTSI